MKRTCGLALFLLILGLFAGASGVSGQEGPPSYSVHYLGSGSVVALNNVNTVVGVRTDAASGVQTPLVSAAGGVWVTLPSPADATSVFPTDINDAGVIVGVASMPNGRRAIRWTPADAGYAVELLPLLPGEVASYATAINNLGQIVGARAGILGTPYGFGWLYSDAGGLVDLNAAYGWFATPNDINDAGVILAGTQTFDLASRALTDVGLSGPSNYNAIGGVAINNTGAVVGSAWLRSTSLNIVSVFRYVPGTGWEFISGSSRYTVANDINNLGDVGWGERGAGLYLDGLGAFALFTLLDPAAAAAGWTITGSGCLINDQRAVATVGHNAITAVAGAVLLTPAGLLPPPAAPTNLTAAPHPATAAEPYLSIDLAWNNGDVLLTKHYELERSSAGQSVWAQVSLVPPAMGTFHQDTTVSPAASYDYRARAVGVAGPGPWSALATATAPAIPLDTTPPQVTILAPANGAAVSGIVTVSAEASDNVGVEFLEISYWNQYLGQEIILGSVAKAGSLTVNWDTRGLTPAAYAVRAFAHDAIGNWRQTEISVNVNQPLDSGNDSDGDGVADATDNCPQLANATQVDTDSDGIGDACDACPVDASNDVDGDGICGSVDNCPDESNADQLDTDSDGTGNTCEVPVLINAAPSLLTVPTADPDGSYPVSWGASATGGVTYVLEEATNSEFTANLRVAYSGVSLNAGITGRGNGTYYYRVKATKEGNTVSSWVNGTTGTTVTLPVMEVPPAPQLMHSTQGINLSLAWRASTGATGYKIHYSAYPNNRPEDFVSFDVGNQTSLTVQLWMGASYYVAVEAYNTGGSSGFSNVELVTINPSVSKPSAPVAAVETRGQRAKISWAEVQGATGYTLHYAPIPYTGEQSLVSVDLGNQTSFEGDLWSGAAFYIAITAKNEAGQSDFSNVEQLLIQ